MKKALTFCLMILLVVSMSINALAIPGGFISSPSGNRPPILVTFDPVDEDCTADLEITDYSDREKLPDDKRQAMEEAYDDIRNADDLTNLSDDLKDLAKDKEINSDKLGVSDLFDLSSTGDCDDHDGHKQYKVTLEADTLEHFVGLIYRDDDGKWHLVEDAKIVDGKLQFTAQGFYPYAVVVDTTEGNPSKTSDTGTILICGSVMAVSAVALVVVLVKGKKRSA